MKKKIFALLLVWCIFFAAAAGTMTEVKAQGTGEKGTKSGTGYPSNSVHYCTKEDDGSDYTDWSYVYFGSYPQTEVTGSDLTSAITEASYDVNGDAWIDGTKYRRISRSDTNSGLYFGDSTYRYFKWERIKWRVLKNDGSTLFVAADKGLDCKKYNEEYASITWEDCTVRNWLNGTFYNTAFSIAEQGAVVSQMVVNEDNPYYDIEGGNNTKDKVYLLSIGEVTDPSYGFCEDTNTFSADRWMQASDYSHAMGACRYSETDYQGNCWWWLRSPGNDTRCAAYIYYYGYVSTIGVGISFIDAAIVPALHINLSSDLWYTADDETSGDGQPPAEKMKVSSVSLNKTSETLTEGEKLQLTATVSPKDAADTELKWESSDPAATVDATGLVTAQKPGTAVITATAEDGSGVSAQCMITVKAKESGNGTTEENTKPTQKPDIETGDQEPSTEATEEAAVPAVKVELSVKNLPSSKKIYLAKGKSQTLKAKLFPADTTDTLAWSSSKPSVVSVKNGKIKGKKTGTAKITATSSSGKKASCTVTVLSRNKKSVSVKLNKKSLSLKKGKIYSLKATLKPANSTDTVRWKSSNKKVASVDSYGCIKAKKKGKTTVTVLTKSGKKASCKVTVK